MVLRSQLFSCNWNLNANSGIGIGVLFLKVIGIGENVIGIVNYFSITFPVKSCHFSARIICYRQLIKYNILCISNLFAIMYHNIQILNKAAVK